MFTLAILSLMLVLGGVAHAQTQAAPAETSTPSNPNTWTAFDNFIYSGTDPYSATVAPGQYLNPILAGFYPDPSICRAGDDYYLVNSTFAWWPGVTLFHSKDLVHWQQLDHILNRPSQLNLTHAKVSEGVFAPAITFHDGLFYMVTTGVYAGGNFFVTATDPRGPWSEPVMLPDIDGIDPSFVFDGDRTFIVHNGPPDGPPLYNGHRAIRIREIDRKTGQALGPSKVLVNGGMHLEEKPIWSEGPHIYHVGDYYYLCCAEGGTGTWHAQMIYRSKAVDGPYEPYQNNPILTQRHLPKDRPNPVTCAGHADLIETPSGEWFAVFLAVRPYAGGFSNIGRETFLLPVTWKDGWPTILEKDAIIPRTLPKPHIKPDIQPEAEVPPNYQPLTGSFAVTETFDSPLGPQWMSLRIPHTTYATPTAGQLRIQARPDRLTTPKGTPALVARRQQHHDFSAQVTVTASVEPAQAGLTAFQNEQWHFFLGTQITGGNLTEVFLERVENGKLEVVARAPLSAPLTAPTLDLKVTGKDAAYTFHYRAPSGDWFQLGEVQDGTILSTDRAKGFVGTMLGLHVRK
jgi:alpha-N-arabinofuranosidase